MELAEIMAIIGRRWRIIAATVVVALVAAVGALAVLPRQYQARTEVFVTTTGGTTPDQLLSAFTLSQHRAKAYAEAVTSPLVLEPVAQSVGYPGGESALEPHVSATVGLDSVVVSIVVSDEDADRAVRIAKATADQLDQAADDLAGKTDPAVGLAVIREASTAGQPVTPSRRIVVGVALVAGLLAGLVLARVREARDAGPGRRRRAAQEA